MRVVVVGGGIIGASAAFHLAEAGVEVTVIERASAASGSSGKPVGGVRAQFSDPVNIELGARSLRAWQRFDTRPGGDISLEPVGYLFLLSREADIPVFEDAVALQRTFEVPSRMLTAAEVHELCPWIPADSVLAGTFSPSDGHARPPAAVRAYLAAAVALGTVLHEHTEVVGIRMHGDRVVGADVATASAAGAVGRVAETLPCDAVVLAAGAWSASIGSMVGVDLPVVPRRRQLGFVPLSRPAALPRPAETQEIDATASGTPEFPGRESPMGPEFPAWTVPFTLDVATSAYFHEVDRSLLIGWADPAEAPGFGVGTDDAWPEGFRAFARERAPELADVHPTSYWAGLYEDTPDHNALIGRANAHGGPAGVVYACGFSGHGFLQAPAVGELVRDLVLDRTPPLDATSLSAARFTTSALRPETYVI